MAYVNINHRGFTLIEVLVAVGVLSVASLAFLPSFTKANKERNLQQNAETVKDAIATARNRALTEVGNPNSATRYIYSGVKFVDNSPTYVLFRSMRAHKDVCLNLDTDTAEVVKDSTRKLSGNVVADLKLDSNPADGVDDGENPTCFFFEFGTGNAFVSKGTNNAAACLSN